MNIATLGQGAKVIELILQKGTPSEQLQQLLTTGLLADLLDANVRTVNREDFRKLLGLGNLMPDLMELPGIVLPEQAVTFGDRLAAGGYGWKDSDITEKRFPLTLAAGPRQLVLAHFTGKEMTSQKVEEWAAANGYEVALIDDLFAVGSHPEYRELQQQFPIIQLGSSAAIRGDRGVPYLYGDGAGRDLDLGWYGDDFSEYCRFLLVRKS